MLKNIMNKMLAGVTAAAILGAVLPNVVFASAEKPTVYVTIENTTYTDENAVWTGKLTDSFPVEISEGDTAMSVLKKAIDLNELTQVGAESGYISEINGLASSAAGMMSGWMGTFNDWFTSDGLNKFYVSDGDEIKMMYTSTGEDLGGSWSNNDKTLKNLKVNTGEFDKKFSGTETEYTLTVPADTECITITPTAANKNFQTRIYKNAEVEQDEVKGPQISGEAEYEGELSGLKKSTVNLTEKLGYYKRSQEIPVSDGDVITVGCGLVGWASMNGGEYGTADSVKGQLYNINIKFAEQADFSTSDELYEVTVKTAPSNTNVDFYTNTGFDENGYDILDKSINTVDRGVENDYHVYTMQLPKGTYSYRAKDENGNSLGGMTFDIPLEVNVDGTGAGECEVVLRQTDIYSTTQFESEDETKYYAGADDYFVEVIDADGKTAVCGDNYIDKSGRTVYPYMLYAGGNAELYLYKIVPTSKRSADYGANNLLNRTVQPGTKAASANGKLLELIDCGITAPAGADVSVSHQIKNFYNEDIAFSSQSENADNTITYIYRVPKGASGYKYRVQAEGKITKAGYLDLKNEETANAAVTFADTEDPKVRPEYDRTTVLGKRMEDNILLNINSQNYLRMNSGDTFKARAYRAAWQIVDSDTANIMIEPDYHYEIVSGDSVRLKQEGQNAVLTAEKQGVTVIKVTYDAIEVGGKTNYTGIYGAIDPSREGMFVVNVDSDVQTELDLNTDWDSEFDTVYFFGDSGTFTFAPKSEAEITVEADGKEYTADENGNYKITIKEGNNLVKVTAGEREEYIVVKGGKIKANITNVTNPNEQIKQGDTVSITFDGLHMPIPKFSGIYNPGFGGTMKVAYKTSDGGTVTSAGTQYDFISNNALTFTVWEEGTYNLTDGYIPMSSMGSKFGAHRNISDTGVGANFNASAVEGRFSSLPNISVEVAKNEDLTYLDNARKTYCALSSVSILDGNSTWQKMFSISNTNQKTASNKMSAATFGKYDAEYPLTVKAVPVNSGVNMEFRYWEEGDTQKNIYPLKAGEILNLGTGVISGEKTLNMEIAVKPINPIYGSGEIYSYVVYKNSDEYAKAMLQALKIKNVADWEESISGADFEEPYGILYSQNGTGLDFVQTEYYTYVPKQQEKIIVSAAKKTGTNDITVNDETKSVSAQEVEYTPITLSDEETIVKITVSDLVVPREYKVHILKKSEIEIEKSNAIDIVNDACTYVTNQNLGENINKKAEQAKNDAVNAIAEKENIQDIKAAVNDGYNKIMAFAKKNELDLAKETAIEYINSAYTQLSANTESELLKLVAEIKDDAIADIQAKTTAEDIENVKESAYKQMSKYANVQSSSGFDIDGDNVNFEKMWKIDGKVIISAKANEKMTLNLYAVKYDDNKIMNQIVIIPVVLEKGDNLFDADCTFDGNVNTRIFIWDDNLKPYTSVIK